MPSARYRQLKAQIGRLGRALLPRDLKKDIVDLPARISVRALSYRILCHAEFEKYFEERAVEIARAVDQAWKGNQKISRATLCLLAFQGGELKKLPDTLKPPPKKKQTDWDALIRPNARLSQCITSYMHYVENQNHGIREEHIIKILLPIGITPEDLDELIISELNDLATKRGDVAHGRAFGHVQRGVNPRDEHAQVMRILAGLLDIDLALDAALKGAG